MYWIGIYLARVDVDGVQGVPGESHTSSDVALRKEGIIAACVVAGCQQITFMSFILYDMDFNAEVNVG